MLANNVGRRCACEWAARSATNAEILAKMVGDSITAQTYGRATIIDTVTTEVLTLDAAA